MGKTSGKNSIFDENKSLSQVIAMYADKLRAIYPEGEEPEEFVIMHNGETDTVSGIPLIRDKNPKPFDVDHNGDRPFVIDTFTINMKEWANGNPVKPGYAARVCDGSGETHVYIASGTELGSAKLLLDELKKKNIVMSGATDVEIIAPKEMLANEKINFGVHSRCRAIDLQYEGIYAIDFLPTTKYDAKTRLSSVLHMLTDYARDRSEWEKSSKELFIYSQYDEDANRHKSEPEF